MTQLNDPPRFVVGRPACLLRSRSVWLGLAALAVTNALLLALGGIR